MKKWVTGAGILSLAFAFSAQLAVQSQTAAPNAPPAAAPGGGLVILDFKPAMDDLMTMLIQPRHLKLYYAGTAKNWELAGFELNELRQSLARIGRTIPNYRKMNVDETVASIFTERLQAVDAAIKSKDEQSFSAAYKDMTTACNECHVTMEHPFIVMKTPDASIFPDQDFTAKPNP
jgi:hypothetical protein